MCIHLALPGRIVSFLGLALSAIAVTACNENDDATAVNTDSAKHERIVESNPPADTDDGNILDIAGSFSATAITPGVGRPLKEGQPRSYKIEKGILDVKLMLIQ